MLLCRNESKNWTSARDFNIFNKGTMWLKSHIRNNTHWVHYSVYLDKWQPFHCFCPSRAMILFSLLNNTVRRVLYAVDTLCNDDCRVLFCYHQTEFTHKYICIYTKKTPPFLYLLKNVHYSCFISINIYKEAFCKWTSIAYMLVRMDSPRDFIVSCILYYCIIVVFLLFKSWFGNIFGGWVFGPAHQTHS